MEKTITIIHNETTQRIEVRGMSDMEALGLLRYYEKRYFMDLVQPVKKVDTIKEPTVDDFVKFLLVKDPNDNVCARILNRIKIAFEPNTHVAAITSKDFKKVNNLGNKSWAYFQDYRAEFLKHQNTKTK